MYVIQGFYEVSIAPRLSQSPFLWLVSPFLRASLDRALLTVNRPCVIRNEDYVTRQWQMFTSYCQNIGDVLAVSQKQRLFFSLFFGP